MKTYSILVTLFLLVAVTRLYFPSFFISDRNLILSESIGQEHLRGEYTVDSVYDCHAYSYIKFHISADCREKFLYEFNLHTANETEHEMRGKIPIDNLVLTNTHKYLYLKNGQYGYIILDLYGDTLIEWKFYDD